MRILGLIIVVMAVWVRCVMSGIGNRARCVICDVLDLLFAITNIIIIVVAIMSAITYMHIMVVVTIIVSKR